MRTVSVVMAVIAISCGASGCRREASRGTLTPAPIPAPIASADARQQTPPTLELGADLDAAPVARPVGPFEVAFHGKRNVYFATPPTPGRHRLIANLHGLCNPPGYACGYWTHAASEQGFLVCPEGNTTCGAGGPPSWDESFVDMDRDLEKSIDTVSARYDGEVSRDGAILTGFSRGAWAAPTIAAMHPGRWRYLILNEADVTLTSAGLKGAGVKAVVLMAGEYGSQLAGERATVQRLEKEGFRAKLIVMPKAGHYYSANIDDLMKEAMDFVTADDAT
jgi:predicted esterase